MIHHSQWRPLCTALPLISPWLIGLAVLIAYPFWASLYWSFCEYDVLTSPRWIGWANYRRLADELWEGGPLATALWNTAYYVLVSVPLSIAFGVLLAVMLSWRVRGQAVYRTLMFLPSVVPTVATAVLWMWILDPQQGILNHLLSDWCGLPAQNWFQSTSEAAWPASWPNDEVMAICGSKDGLVLMSLWGVGNFMVIYLAALGDIPHSLYEAAELDGAGPLRRFRHVTLPMLTPVIFFNLVVGIIQGVQAFTQVYLVSDGQGDPAGSTLLVSLHLFLAAFRDLEVGYASAIAWLLFVVVLLVTIVLFRSSRGWVHYHGVLLLVLLGGCANRATSLDREEVVFWHFWGGRDQSVVDDIVSRFNDSQDRYAVRAVAMPGNNLDLKLFLSVAGGQPPDLVNQDDPIVADWARRGALIPIDELASAEESAALVDWLFPAARSLATYAGRCYAVPNGLDIRALYYNRTLLEEHGLKPPHRLAELDRIAVTIAPPADTELSRMGFLPDPRRIWVWGIVFGGQFYDPQAATLSERVTVDSRAIVSALSWMAGYADRYGHSRVAAFRSGDQALTGAAFPLLSGRRYALIMDGQWRVRDIAAATAAARESGTQCDQFGVVPLPTPPGGRDHAGWVNGNFFIVPRGARQTRGAWEFMKFWSGFGGNESEAARACAAGGWIPVSEQVVQQPAFQAFLAAQPLMQTFVSLAGSEAQVPTPSVPDAAFYYREVVAAAQDTMYRGADPTSRLQLAATRIRQRLATVRPPAPPRTSELDAQELGAQEREIGVPNAGS